MRYIIFFLSLVFNSAIIGLEQEKPTADLIIFSYDRPMQLYALLESIELNVKNLGRIVIIYRVSDSNFEKAYNEVSRRFSNIEYIKQGAKPHAEFKNLVLKCMNRLHNQHIIFAVDDIIVIDEIDISECVLQIEKTDAYAFFLRLGKNIVIHSPQMIKIQKNMYAWCFFRNKYGWGYPNTVDMTIYRKKDVEDVLRQLSFVAPNTLESGWAKQIIAVQKKYGLCYESSRIVNIPMNIVQTDLERNHSMNYSVKDLLKLFFQRKKIDISVLQKVKYKACHMDLQQKFINRE